MRILISPAKKMKVANDAFAPQSTPLFLSEAQTILQTLQNLSDRQLQSLWKCSDALATQSIPLVRTGDLTKLLSPAIFSYEGIQYQYMAPHVMETPALAYLQTHLRILSGLYGMVRPLDGIIRYRLEMQSKCKVADFPHLYAFWGDKLAKALEVETDCLLNLASEEYSRAVAPFLSPSTRLVQVIFGEQSGAKIMEKGTLCKMARGRMVHWLAEHRVQTIDNCKAFPDAVFSFSKEHSDDSHLVFLKQPQ